METDGLFGQFRTRETLETFLRGMETLDIPSRPILPVHLETFLRGMETLSKSILPI